MTSSFFSFSVSSVSVGLSTFSNFSSGLSHISSTLFRALWHSRPSFRQEISDGLESLDCPVTRKLFLMTSSLTFAQAFATILHKSSLDIARRFPCLVYDFVPCSSHLSYSARIYCLKGLFQETSGAWRTPVHPPGINAWCILFRFMTSFVWSLMWARNESQTSKRLKKFNLLWALIRVWALIPTNYFRLGSNSRMGLNSSRGPNSSKYGIRLLYPDPCDSDVNLG